MSFRAALARHWLPFSLLAALALLFFWPVTLNLGWIPRGGGDLVSFLWPTYSYAAQALGAGRVPLWNPTLYAGAPFAADNQSGVFYPINWLAFLLAPGLPYRALEWLVVFHVWWAGVGTYWFVRAEVEAGNEGNGGTPWPALFAAVAFMFSEVFITHIGNLNIVAVAAWLPWGLWALQRAFARRSTGWALGAGVCLGLAALAGHAQLLLMIAGALGLYALWLAATTPDLDWPRRLKYLVLPFLVALGLSALAIFPALEMTTYTGRARLDYAAAAEYSLPWAGLAGLFSPLLFGRGAAAFWGPWARVELGYLGVLPLFFAPFAFLRPPHEDPKTRRKPEETLSAPFVPVSLCGSMFFFGLTCLGLGIALGENTPLHWLFYQLVPGFAQLRVPARFLLLTDFGLAVLGGLGLARWGAISFKHAALWGGGLLVSGSLLLWAAYQSTLPQVAEARAPLVLVFTLPLVLLVVGVGLTLPPLRRWAGPLAVLVLAVDLVGHGAGVEVERNDPTLGFQHPAVVAFLQSQPGPTRIENTSSAWSPDAAARFGLEDIGGISNPLALAAYQTYLGAVGPRGSARYNFLNVQFVIADKDQPPADASFIPVFNEDPQLDVYLNTQARPRVALVYSATVVDSGEAAFGALFAPGFDPAQTVVAQALADPLPPSLALPGPTNLYYLSYAPEEFTLVAQTTGPAYLVFSEVWYPGWRAWVDGAETPIFKANFAFRGLVLRAAGEHVVRLRFEPLSWQLGLGVSLLTLLGLVGWGVRRR